MKPVVCLLVLATAATLVQAAEPAEVAFYSCQQCASPPVIDGRLDDACWRDLPVMDQFYQYWTPVPQPPPLQTAARLCYDARGLYMGITMHEDQLDKIKAEVNSRDDPETWHDDCVEIMVDPHNTGSSYYKFTTNFNAARHDQKTTNLVLDDGWNVEGWQVKTSRGEGAWYIEFFLPWTDIDASPKEGDIWSFDLVRYGWATGEFKGVSWSLGGSGAAPARHGYLAFGAFDLSQTGNLKRLADIVRRTKGDSFRIMTPTTMLTHEPNGQWTRQELGAWLAGAEGDATRELDEAKTACAALADSPDVARLRTALAEVEKRAGELRAETTTGTLKPATAMFAYHEYRQLARKAAEAKWEGKVLELVATAAQ